MRVNYILPAVFKSGGVRIIFEYANRLTDMGHDVCVYYPALPFDSYKKEFSLRRLGKYIRFFGFHLKSLISRNFYNYKFKIRIVPFINDNFIRPADFVIATTWHTAAAVKKLQDNKGIKVYFIQGYENWDANTGLVNKSYTLGLNSITISSSLSNFFKDKFNLKTTLIYNGLDKNKFYFENSNKDFQLRRILFIEYGLEKKNVKALIQEIKKVKEKYPQLEFACFGLGKITSMPDYIKFYENPDDALIRELYNGADLFLFPSLYEGFGLPPAEAMACKCAVASTAVGAIPEYVIHNQTGFILKNDLSNVLEIIDNLINNQEKLKNISEDGYKKINEFLDWDKSVSELLKYFHSLKRTNS